MKSPLFKPAFYLAALGIAASSATLQADSLTVEGDLNVDGKLGVGTNAPSEKLEVAGNVKVNGTSNYTGKAWFNFGSNIANYSWMNAALTTSSIEIVNSNGTVTNSSPTLGFHRHGSGGPQFRLDAGGSRVLYLESANLNSARNPNPYGGGTNSYFDRFHVDGKLSTSGNVGIGLATPTEKLEVAGNVKVNGTLTVTGSVSLPNQTGGGGTHILTYDLADSRYVQKASGAWGEIAIGEASDAQGSSSIAIGGGATAFGSNSTVIGFGGLAYAESGIAIGTQANATGDFAIAIGHHTIAWGGGSTALGLRTNAEGIESTALGFLTYARAQNSTALGTLNVHQGDPYNWVPTDDLVAVGNGQVAPSGLDGQRSNAFVIHKNGNVRAAGNIQAKGGVRVPPMGDLTMGEFTAGANPADPATGLNAGLRYPQE